MKIKRNLLTILSFFCVGWLSAQIGINTENPNISSIIHIDGAGNNSTNISTKFIDDVTFTKDGNLGLGTLNPQAKVDVDGTFRYVDGNQKEGRILRSDALGNARWQDFTVINIAIWNMQNASFQISSYNEIRLSGTPSISNDTGIGIESSIATSSVKVPSGRYVIFVSSNFTDVQENGWLKLYIEGNPTAIFSTYYSMQLSGVAAYLETSSTVTLYPTFQAVNDGVPYFRQPSFTSRLDMTLTFMKI